MRHPHAMSQRQGCPTQNGLLATHVAWYYHTKIVVSNHFYISKVWYYHTNGGDFMLLYPTQFGIVLKNARMDKKLTQAELAENLDISLSYLKDLERFRNKPSYEVFERTIRYFNLSADTVIYPDKNMTNGTYQKINRLLSQCNEDQLKVVLATTEALLSTCKISYNDIIER